MSHPMGSRPTTNQMQAAKYIADAIVDTILAHPGISAGQMYAAVRAYEPCTIDQFNRIMAGLVRVGRLTQSGNLYRAAV